LAWWDLNEIFRTKRLRFKIAYQDKN